MSGINTSSSLEAAFLAACRGWVIVVVDGGGGGGDGVAALDDGCSLDDDDDGTFSLSFFTSAGLLNPSFHQHSRSFGISLVSATNLLTFFPSRKCVYRASDKGSFSQRW